MKPLLAAAFLATALAGCASEPVRRVQALLSPKGEAALAAGLRQYEDGRYADAAKSLESAIELGVPEWDRVNAHKHLAFIHCASGRERNCREEFGKALALDPALELTPAESGHPAWGPVFRALKARR